MTKKLNIEGIANELKEQSAFFRGASPPPEETLLVEAHQEPLKQSEKSSVSAPVASPERSESEHLPTSPSFPVQNQTERPNDRTVVRTDERSYGRRSTTRHSFEFFRDQIETLKQFSLEEKLRGEQGSMSEMIREAVDMYIAKRRNRDAA
jgi:hypothetical protein